MAETDEIAEIKQEQAEQGAAIHRIEEALAKVLPGSHAEAEARTERRLDRGSTAAEKAADMEEQTAAVIAQLDKRAADKADADAAKADEDNWRARVAKLEERPPAPPRSRAKRWGTGWEGA